MKKLYAAIIISAVCILVLPWGYFIFESNTSEFLLSLAFVIYPIASIVLGALASGDLKRHYYTIGALFIATPCLGWRFLGHFEIGFLLYSAIYLVLFFIALWITGLIKNKKG